jgi:hypothetical protein
MPVERTPGGTSLIDVLDRILDKGIVIDAWVRISLVGIDLITVEARVVVASIDTYLRYAEAMGITQPIARPGAVGPGMGGELGPGEALPGEAAPETRATRTRRGEELA